MPTPNSIAGRADALRPFVCSSTGGGLDAAWIHVAGALDLATSRQLERTLAESAARLVVLDMRDIGFMDCSGVHAIVEASHRAREEGRRLRSDPAAVRLLVDGWRTGCGVDPRRRRARPRHVTAARADA